MVSDALSTTSRTPVAHDRQPTLIAAASSAAASRIVTSPRLNLFVTSLPDPRRSAPCVTRRAVQDTSSMPRDLATTVPCDADWLPRCDSQRATTTASFVMCIQVVPALALLSLSIMLPTVLLPPRNHVCVVALPRWMKFASGEYSFASG